jgi:uncharacterized protein YjdB
MIAWAFTLVAMACGGSDGGQPVAPSCVVDGASVAPSSPSIVAGDSVRVTLSVATHGSCATGGASVTWQSSDATIATVSRSDVTGATVVAVAPGQATITMTARAGSDSRTAAVSVTVTSSVATVEVSAPSSSVRVGSTLQLTAVAKNAAGAVVTGRPITWSSGDQSRATVSQAGVLTGVSAGIATITANVDGKTGAMTVTVTAPVARVDVTPTPSTISVGETVQLSAATRDAQGNVVSGRTVTWQTANAAVATVSGTGLVTGIAAGGPVTITATSEGIGGTASVTVAAPPAAPRIAYGVADQPQAATPYAAALAFNSSGGAITVMRQAVGAYRVTLAGQATPNGETETLLVTRYGEGSSYCKLAGDWANGFASDLVADVRCYAYTGASADAAFSIMLLGRGVLAGRFGFALANQPSAAGPYAPAKTFHAGPTNPAPIAISRTSVGQYAVRFTDNGGAPNDAEAIHVTAAGAGNVRCNVAQMTGDVAQVGCYAPDDAPADSPFSIVMLDRGRSGSSRTAYLWAVDANEDEYEAIGTYALPATRAYSTSGGAVELTKLAAEGRYDVVLRGLASGGSPGILGVQVVNRDSDEPKFCGVVSWTASGSDLRVTVQCWHSDGEPEDEGFYLLVIQ